jgi:hypothetical protein
MIRQTRLSWKDSSHLGRGDDAHGRMTRILELVQRLDCGYSLEFSLFLFTRFCLAQPCEISSGHLIPGERGRHP